MKKPSVVFIRSRMASRQRGAALLEALIAFFILSIGLLGLAALQMKSTQFNQGSYQRSQATLAAYDILDRMRLNRVATDGGLYEIDWSANSAAGGTIVSKDLSEWLNNINTTLPDGQGRIQCDGNQVCTVGICWRDRFDVNNGSGDCGSINNGWELLEISTQMWSL